MPGNGPGFRLPRSRWTEYSPSGSGPPPSMTRCVRRNSSARFYRQTMFVASPRDSDEWRPNEDINQPQEISRMSAPIEPQGTGYLTDEEMAQIRQQADAAWAMSQPSLPASALRFPLEN